MVNRRNFVQTCLGAGLIGPVQSQLIKPVTPSLNTYQQILNKTQYMDLLGHPRSWSLVERVLHPFAPERVVIMPGRQNPYYLRSNQKSRQIMDEYITTYQDKERIRHEKQADSCRSGTDPCWSCKQSQNCYYQQPYNQSFSQAKRESIFWIISIISNHYHVPYLDGWVHGLTDRELLASTGLGDGFALAHQYQYGAPGPVPVQCPPIDWWMFLYPAGTDWEALDENLIHAVLITVFQNGLSEAGHLRIWCLASHLARMLVDGNNLAWQQLSKMNRVEACHILNHAMAQCIYTLS